MSLIFACLLAAAVDGDTIRCANIEGAGGRVRLARIDAPERGRPGAAEATAALAGMIAQGEVWCHQVDALSDAHAGEPRLDRFGRIVARCRVGERGQDLGGRLMRAGLVTVWP